MMLAVHRMDRLPRRASDWPRTVPRNTAVAGIRQDSPGRGGAARVDGYSRRPRVFRLNLLSPTQSGLLVAGLYLALLAVFGAATVVAVRMAA
jgi:hypothetical protein